MNRFSQSALGLVACAASTIAIAAASVTPVLAEGTVLKAAIHDNPPFGGTTPGGYCLDLLTELAKRTGKSFEYRAMPVAAMNAALHAGEIDVFCSPMGGTPVPGAPTQPTWVGPIASNSEILLVAADDDRVYPTLLDAKDRRIGTIRGTGYAEWAEKQDLPDLQLFANMAEGLTALEAGQIDVFLGAETLYRYQHDILGRWAGAKPAAGFEGKFTNYPALGMRTADAALITEFQAGLDAISADGTMATLLGKWALPPPTE